MVGVVRLSWTGRISAALSRALSTSPFASAAAALTERLRGVRVEAKYDVSAMVGMCVRSTARSA